MVTQAKFPSFILHCLSAPQDTRVWHKQTSLPTNKTQGSPKPRRLLQPLHSLCVLVPISCIKSIHGSNAFAGNISRVLQLKGLRDWNILTPLVVGLQGGYAVLQQKCRAGRNHERTIKFTFRALKHRQTAMNSKRGAHPQTQSTLPKQNFDSSVAGLVLKRSKCNASCSFPALKWSKYF